MPAHALPVGFELGQGGARDCHEGNVVVLKMRAGAVDMVGHEGAAGAPFRPARTEHEMLDDQLAASVEQLSQRLPALWAVEYIGLVDLEPGQHAPVRAQAVALPGKLLLLDEMLPMLGQPLIPRHDSVLHVDLLRLKLTIWLNTGVDKVNPGSV